MLRRLFRRQIVQEFLRFFIALQYSACTHGTIFFCATHRWPGEHARKYKLRLRPTHNLQLCISCSCVWHLDDELTCHGGRNLCDDPMNFSLAGDSSFKACSLKGASQACMMGGPSIPYLMLKYL